MQSGDPIEKLRGDVPAEFIEGVRRRANPDSWILDDELMAPVVSDLEEAAATNWPDENLPRTIKRRSLITVFER